MREGDPCLDNMNISYINLNYISNTRTRENKTTNILEKWSTDDRHNDTSQLNKITEIHNIIATCLVYFTSI